MPTGTNTTGLNTLTGNYIEDFLDYFKGIYFDLVHAAWTSPNRTYEYRCFVAQPFYYNNHQYPNFDQLYNLTVPHPNPVLFLSVEGSGKVSWKYDMVYQGTTYTVCVSDSSPNAPLVN